MVLPLILVAVFVVAITTYWYIKFYSYDLYLKDVPGPPALPILGSAYDYATTSILLLTDRYRKQYGTLFKTYIGFFPPTLIISNAKMVEFVLTSPNLLQKGRSYKFFKNWLGNGLILSKGQRWKKHRKMLTFAFHMKILEQFVEVFEKFGGTLVETFEKVVGNTSINLYPLLSLAALDIICASAMGTDIKAQTNSDSKYVHSVQEMCRIIMDRITQPLKTTDSFYYLSKDYKKEKEVIDIMHKFTASVVKSRKQKFQNALNNNLDSDEDSEIGMKKRLTFLDTMLNLQETDNALTDDEIRQEVDNFMFAGHESTALTSSFLLYSLANHPEIQEKVVNELRSIYGDDKDRKMEFNDFNEMKYLEMVIKETLRLYPPAPLISRQVTKDFKYENLTLREGTEMTISIYGLHRDPSVFEDPERFDPERFTPENQTKRPNFSYIPFSAGNRNCIGQKYAMLEVKAIATKILRNFELLPAFPKHSLQLGGDIGLRSENGFCVHVKRRKF